jgi:hypothetical protein
VTAPDLRGGLPPDARAAVDGYLVALAAGLPVSRRSRRDILAEVGDGLSCAVEARMRSGADVQVAVAGAVAEFGSPGEVAAAFAERATSVIAHRAGLALVLTGPAVGLAWVNARGGEAGDGIHRVAGMLSAVPLFAVVLAITVPAAIVATAGAGRLARRLRPPVSVTGRAALVAMSGAIVGDVSLVAAVAGGDLGQPHAGLLAVAIGLSVVRLSAASLTARRIAALRAASS